MVKSGREGKNLRLAGVFVFLVVGLIVMSLAVKIIFIVRDSHFDGSHKFNVVFSSEKTLSVASFSPSNNSFSVLKINENIKPEDVSKKLEVPIDGIIVATDDITEKNISSTIFKSLLPLGNSYKNMTIFDVVRVFLFSRSVSDGSVYVRELSSSLNPVQRSTVITLSFTDPSIYQENQSIEIINSTTVFGLGGRAATAISNMGGNVILVSGSDSLENTSKIQYFGDYTYTVKKLSDFLGFPVEKLDKKAVADVIITIGKDSVGKINF